MRSRTNARNATGCMEMPLRLYGNAPNACTVLLSVPMLVQTAPRCAPREAETLCGKAPRLVLYSTVCQGLYECPRVVLRRQPTLRAEMPRCSYCTPHSTDTRTEMPPRLYCTPHSFEWRNASEDPTADWKSEIMAFLHPYTRTLWSKHLFSSQSSEIRRRENGQKDLISRIAAALERLLATGHVPMAKI